MTILEAARPLTAELARERYERASKALLAAMAAGGCRLPPLLEVKVLFCDRCGVRANLEDPATFDGWVCLGDFEGGWEDFCGACKSRRALPS